MMSRGKWWKRDSRRLKGSRVSSNEIISTDQKMGEAKKDLVEDFSYNFYDRLVDHEKKNKIHDDKINKFQQEAMNL